MSNNHHAVIIIGSGPAGYTAAIYTARANLSPIVFEGLQPGGQLTITTDVENFPGFPSGIMGPELMEHLKAQATRFGTTVVNELITRVDFSKRPFVVATDKTEYTADSVIVATGATAKLLGLPKEKELMGHGVSACATCDGFFFRDKEVVVVGGGDSALEEATFLTRFCSKVTLIHRRDAFRASKIMQERALNHPKVEVIWNHKVADILGTKDTGVTGLLLENTETGEQHEFATQGIFVAIGHQPNTSLFDGQLTLRPDGYVQVSPGTVSTSVEGVFACGDVMDSHYRQAITAAGTGCMAAIDTERYLEVKHSQLSAV